MKSILYVWVFVCVVVASATFAFSQDYGPAPMPGMSPIVVQPQQQQPGTAMPLVPPTQDSWREGWRESWNHEFRPLNKEREYPHNYNYNDSRGYEHDGYIYNNGTGNYQRSVPSTQWCRPTTQYYVQPQTQYYTCPQYTYPQYQQRYVYPQYTQPSQNTYCW